MDDYEPLGVEFKFPLWVVADVAGLYVVNLSALGEGAILPVLVSRDLAKDFLRSTGGIGHVIEVPTVDLLYLLLRTAASYQGATHVAFDCNPLGQPGGFVYSADAILARIRPDYET